MEKLRSILMKLHVWSRFFCDGIVCEKHLKRDAFVVLSVMALLIIFISFNEYAYNKKNQTPIIAGAETIKTPLENTDLLPASSPDQSPAQSDGNISLQSPAKTEKPVTQPVPKKVTLPKSVPTPKTVDSTSKGSSCIKMPTKILPFLKGAPMPSDGKMKNGKLICNVLADGNKDYPHKSNKKPKGQWGGCCYDPDEVPNPNCCYPVGSVYEKYLNDYFKKPFPHKK